MRQTVVLAFLIIGSLAVLPVESDATERTGELLRELLKAVEQDFEVLEKETQGFAHKSSTLTQQFDAKAKAFARTQDPKQKHIGRADLYTLAARLNEQDRQEVQATIRTIGEVRWKLDKIRVVLERGGLMPPKEELPQFRQKMGAWLTATAKWLDVWSQRATPEAQGEIAQLKSNLVAILTVWESQATQFGTSQQELHRTIRTLDHTYSQLGTLQSILEVEKQALQIWNYKAFVDLVLARLTNGKVNVGAIGDVVTAKQQAIGRRGEVLHRLDGSMTSGGQGATVPVMDPGAASIFERIKQGRFLWKE